MVVKRAQVPLVCHGHSRPIVDLSYSPVTDDGFFLMSASKDGKPMLRNGETGDWIGTFEGHKGAVWGACLDPSATIAATASADFSARVWDALSGELMHSFDHKHIVRSVDFAKSGKKIVTGGAEKLIRIFDLERPDADPVIIGGAPATVRISLFHENDSTILAAFNDNTGVRLYDIRTGQPVRNLETKCPTTSVEISRDGQFITTADGKDVKIWDAHKFSLVKSHTLQHAAESATLFPSIKRFVAAGNDMWVRLFDSETGEELECNKGHHGPVHCVRFAPGGESYASGSEDGTIRIWKTVVGNGNDGDAGEGSSKQEAAEDNGVEKSQAEEFPVLGGAVKAVGNVVQSITQKVAGLKVNGDKT
ncbi:Serine/threonine kinase receptor-associated protein [Klebsormidium nitens]|uniref:Serine-threonine kinase receptor-associated protein n=1 Tax=Klebsormidium nitens TaxID=105231 RepID=A0A1Y1HZ40_KLENI|nr:Serine/threonine kinase receptor-associated protein [Klebsormidium nitens]|eukprot:GAQ83002.1 Serine/threonine kinase receptor-associated protein [Klebsormidium nitens]